MPEGLVVVRSTPSFDAATVPVGLLRAHRVAEGVWGRLRVLEGAVRFVFEAPAHLVVELAAGQSVAIPPGRDHHVEVGPGARFVVDFLRPPDGDGQ